MPRSIYDTTSDDPFLEVIATEKDYLRRKFRQDLTDPSTGLGRKRLANEIDALYCKAVREKTPWPLAKAAAFALLAEKQSIGVSPLDWFPAIAIYDRLDRPISSFIQRRAAAVNKESIPADVMKLWQDGNESGKWSIWQDFDHSVPNWESLVEMGFPALAERLGRLSVKGDALHDALGIASAALLGAIKRFERQCEKVLAQNPHSVRLEEELSSLRRLGAGAPETAYDVLLFIWIYFFFSEHLEGVQCRSLSNIDTILWPYYKRDVERGRTTEALFREQFRHFLWQWGSVANYWNQPVGIGGTDAGGGTLFNPLSRIILDVADECNLPSPKFLARVSPSTPRDIFFKLLDMARRRRSVAFIGDMGAYAALKKWWKATDVECAKMTVHGCYEFSLADGANTTGAGHLNLASPIWEILDLPSALFPADFPSLVAKYKSILKERIGQVLSIALWSESVLDRVNPALLFTLTHAHAIEKRLDAFANGCPRGNNSSILAVGFATAVDSLLAMRDILYTGGGTTPERLREILKNNWKGEELLRAEVLRSKAKWGNNDAGANALGAEIALFVSSEINGKPNARGGIFLASGHTARQHIEMGRKTGATPDGRLESEELSKNVSPSMGAESEGVTALVKSAASSSALVLPGDYPLDVMLHPSAASGEDGLCAMKALVDVFHKNGGSVIQFTVFSPEELKDAVSRPDAYANMQVRVCGWNVLWKDLPHEERIAYLKRALAVTA